MPTAFSLMSIESKVDVVQRIVEWARDLLIQINQPETDYEYICFKVEYFITESDLVMLKLSTKATNYSIHASGLVNFEVRLHFI